MKQTGLSRESSDFFGKAVGFGRFGAPSLSSSECLRAFLSVGYAFGGVADVWVPIGSCGSSSCMTDFARLELYVGSDTLG